MFELDIKEVGSNADREKLHIYKTYYGFINNQDCLKFISNAVSILSNADFVKDDDLLTIVIIILKGFITKGNIFSGEQGYVLSDDIYNYVVDQYQYYLISTNRYSPKRNIGLKYLHIIDIIIHANMIVQKNIGVKSGGVVKTIKFYKILDVSYVKNLYEYMLFSYDIFSLINVGEEHYITSHHYSKTFELYKKNFNSDRMFKLKNLNYIMNKINVGLYVDEEYQKDLEMKLLTNEKEIIDNIHLENKLIEELYAQEV